ncbi:MAG: hypothetical protein ACLGH3_09270 [Actinomycetota bacterium]
MFEATDEIFIRAPSRHIQEAFLHLHQDASWWRGVRARGGYGWLHIDAPTGRGNGRIRWKVRIEDAREWEGFRCVFEEGPRGESEFWLEAFGSGTIVHHFLRVEACSPRAIDDHRRAIRIGMNGLKDHLERIAV